MMGKKIKTLVNEYKAAVLKTFNGMGRMIKTNQFRRGICLFIADRKI